MMMLRVVMIGALLLGSLMAQGSVREAEPAPAKPVAKRVVPKSMAPKLSAEARLAFAEARQLEKNSRKVSGPARSRKLELAASCFDRLVAKFEAEPQVAAQAAWHAAELWRRHGSAPLAEKDYLFAAKAHAVRYGQRGLLAAADMQRRQLRTEDAMATYAQAERVDPRTGRAQSARLWMARMLLTDGKVEQAIERLQAALESAPSPRLMQLMPRTAVTGAYDHGSYAALERVADHLAKAWIIKGDLKAAGFVIDHAQKLVDGERGGDPIVAERLRRAFDRMSAKKALQRALDQKTGAAKDAVRLDEHRRREASKAAKAGKAGKAGSGS